MFPVVEIHLFQDTIDTAYSPDSAACESSEGVKACILAFVALMNFYEGCLEDAPVDGEYCAMQATQLMPNLLQPNLVNLQVWIMLVS